MEEKTPPNKARRRQVVIRSKEGLAAELLVLLDSITADGVISESEAQQLMHWLEERADDDLPGMTLLRSVLGHALSDGVLTEKERKEIYRCIERVLPAELRSKARERRAAREIVEKLEADKRAEATRQAEKEQRLRSEPVQTEDFLLAGVSHEGREHIIRELAETGSTVRLIREPLNQYDSNAIAVYLLTGHKIGYAPREIAAYLAPLLDDGFRCKAWIKKILRGSRLPIPVICAFIYRPDTVVPDALSAEGPPPVPQDGGQIKRRQKGCLGCGCMTVAVAALIFLCLLWLLQ